MDCIKIYHTTLIVCAPYFANLNNPFLVKTLLFFVHLRSQQNRTEKVISNYLFEVFRALVKSVEWSDVSGVDSSGSVPGPLQRQRSQQTSILWIYPPQIAIVMKLGIFASFDPCNNIVKVKEIRSIGTHSFPATSF